MVICWKNSRKEKAMTKKELEAVLKDVPEDADIRFAQTTGAVEDIAVVTFISDPTEKEVLISTIDEPRTDDYLYDYFYDAYYYDLPRDEFNSVFEILYGDDE